MPCRLGPNNRPLGAKAPLLYAMFGRDPNLFGVDTIVERCSNKWEGITPAVKYNNYNSCKIQQSPQVPNAVLDT